VRTNDEQLNELIRLAFENIHKPQLKDRTFALEKIWDAFERMKTYYEGMDKKNSAKTLVENVSHGTKDFEKWINSNF
jgi:abortive infection bacteriophage resistance protein